MVQTELQLQHMHVLAMTRHSSLVMVLVPLPVGLLIRSMQIHSYLPSAGFRAKPKRAWETWEDAAEAQCPVGSGMGLVPWYTDRYAHSFDKGMPHKSDSLHKL
jgi:hypothetical protein